MPRKGGPVFVEIMPILAGRTVLITVAKVDDKTLRVNVIPRGKADDNPDLSTSLSRTSGEECARSHHSTASTDSGIGDATLDVR